MENKHLVQFSDNLGMLTVNDWMNIPGALWIDEEVVEIRFKKNRKEFFRNRPGLSLERDDRVVVELEGGYDLGTVYQVGEAVNRLFEEEEGGKTKSELNKVHRKATKEDLQKWLDAKRKERDMLVQARRLSVEAGLRMNISDVEFQGDGRKATLYYTSGNSVDLKQLMRHHASAFQVKIELQSQR